MKVLFVCLGNICRSPLAEGVFTKLVHEHGLAGQITVDSCGTGAWHVGEAPHRGSQKIARAHDIDISNQRARQLNKSDLREFDFLIAMDRANRDDIEMLDEAGSATVYCLREFDPSSSASDLDVPDPYYSGGFDKVYEIIERSCEHFLEHVRATIENNNNV